MVEALDSRFRGNDDFTNPEPIHDPAYLVVKKIRVFPNKTPAFTTVLHDLKPNLRRESLNNQN